MLELIASDMFNAAEAARRAGYKNPAVRACKLLKDKRIQAILGKAKQDREERTKLTSDQIWEYLHSVLALNPLKLFQAQEDGWYVTDLEEIPDEVGVLIEEVQVEEHDDGNGGVRRRLRVKLVSKASALAIAAKHSIPQQHDVHLAVVDWDKLREDHSRDQDPFGVEQRIVLTEGAQQLAEGSDDRTAG